jgi:phage tail protein X
MNYQTKDGEILDKICYEQYGFTGNAFETVLYSETNYDKTAFDVFSAGMVIDLPPVEPAKKRTETMLWE